MPRTFLLVSTGDDAERAIERPTEPHHATTTGNGAQSGWKVPMRRKRRRVQCRRSPPAPGSARRAARSRGRP
eukprot:scaffold4124_cov378-Prasinococcus_capsulatus_cf.AAC.7